MNPKFIIIDGKTYPSVDEMPPDVRQKYEAALRALPDANGNQIPDAFENIGLLGDKNKNGIPDILEDLAAGRGTGQDKIDINVVRTSIPDNAPVTRTKIVIDGKEFDHIENLPPEARARYEQAMSKLDANRNGIPDFIEGMTNTTNQAANVSTGVETETSSPSAPLPVDSAITPDTTNGLPLALAGLFLLLVCLAGAAALWYFFLRG